MTFICQSQMLFQKIILIITASVRTTNYIMSVHNYQTKNEYRVISPGVHHCWQI